MKLQTFIFSIVLTISFNPLLAMSESLNHNFPTKHQRNLLMIPINSLPFVCNAAETEACSDSGYQYSIDSKTFLLLILESHQHAQTHTAPHFFELLKKLQQGIIRIGHNNGYTYITLKDLKHRLLSNIRAAGTPIAKFDPYAGRALGHHQTPVVIKHSLAYLHTDIPTENQNTELRDYSDRQEISSIKFQSCLQSVNEIVQGYKG